MEEQVLPEGQEPRLFSEQQAENLKQEVLETALAERPEIVGAHLEEVKTFINNGLGMVQQFEKATYQKHPKIHTDTDVIYIDSGPGPYSYKTLEPGKTDLDDVNYHKWKWSRKMDRARLRAAYTLASMITTKRIVAQTGLIITTKDLTPEDFKQYGPYFMYTSTPWQNAEIQEARKQLKGAEFSKIPDSKLHMYSEFATESGEIKEIVHTEDQIQGFQFPANPDGSPPRRIAIVSHPAHLMRIFHILGKYPSSIPEGTIIQPFPIPTPTDAVTEYAKAELLGTLGTVFSKDRASLIPYDKYQL